MTVLPAKSISIGQKLVENAKIEKIKWDILGNFQVLWLLPNAIYEEIVHRMFIQENLKKPTHLPVKKAFS